MPRSNIQSIIFGLLTGALIFGFIILSKQTTVCSENYRQDAKLKVSGITIDVQEARSSAEKIKGLGGRNCLRQNQGMLFVFDQNGYYPFWMKDMKFAIDIAWIDNSGFVIDTKSNAQPSSYPTSYTNRSPANKVLELPAGRLEQLNIGTGTKIN